MDFKYCRTEIINRLIKKYDYKTYLEIGVREARQNFNQIYCEQKEAVDPAPRIPCTYVMTSDKFFVENKKKYDLIFIDGDHHDEQVRKDIENSLKILNVNGTIVMHDCSPQSKFQQRETYEFEGKFPSWNGTVWKSFARLRCERDDLEMYCVNADHGCGIIRVGKQTKFEPKPDSYTWEYLEEHREQLLNLITVDKFKELF